MKRKRSGRKSIPRNATGRSSAYPWKPRKRPTAATPGNSRSRFSRARSTPPWSVAPVQVAADRYRSACSVVSSQLRKVSRKLPTMTVVPTSMAKATATPATATPDVWRRTGRPARAKRQPNPRERPASRHAPATKAGAAAAVQTMIPAARTNPAWRQRWPPAANHVSRSPSTAQLTRHSVFETDCQRTRARRSESSSAAGAKQTSMAGPAAPAAVPATPPASARNHTCKGTSSV